MKQFFKFMFASMLGFLLVNLLLFFLMIIIFASIASMGSSDVTVVQKNSILTMKLNQPIYDRAPANPDFSNFPSFSMDIHPGLDDILKNLEKAKRDDNIKGIYLDLSVIPAGFAMVNEIRNGILDFKESEKFVICYSENLTQGAYYLATAADKIYMNPEGLMLFKGINAELMFFKGALEKLDIEMQVVRPEGNKFKSAVEPFFLDKMSDANREQMSRILESLWGNILTEISETRGVSIEELNTICDDLLIREPEDAVNFKLIDGVMYKDEIIAELKEKVGIDDKKNLKTVSLTDYTSTVVKGKKKVYTKDKIAVVYAIGSIEMGNGDDYTIGSARISKAIRKARLDTNVRAIVLRVNSPGGDALASDIILREIILSKKEKPVVASYGSVAASGGYWISCVADKIIADKNSITGSIGVWGLIPNLQGLYNEKLGITFDEVGTNESSGFIGINRPMTEEERAFMQFQVEDVYTTFLKYVSEARGMSVEEVNNIAQGRVWTGSDAKEIGLIDDFGGLEDAIELAAELAEIENYKIRSLPAQKDFMKQLMEDFTGQKTQSRLQKELGENYRYYQYIKEISKMKGIQARMLFDINVN